MAMNQYRLVGDLSHWFSIVTYLYIVAIARNASGVSLKSHQLYLLVFVSRYLDLFVTFYSTYNTVMKCFFIFSTAIIIACLSKLEPTNSTYSANQDSFQISKLLCITSFLSICIHLFGSGTVNVSIDDFEVHYENYSWMELAWTFSICLEPLAMIPQLYIFYNNRALNRNLCMAIGLKGFYRFMYILNWIHRAHTESWYRHHYVVYIAGVVQTLSYCDFYLYQAKVVYAWLSARSSSPNNTTNNTELEETPGEDSNVALIGNEEEEEEKQDNAEEDKTSENNMDPKEAVVGEIAVV